MNFFNPYARRGLYPVLLIGMAMGLGRPHAVAQLFEDWQYRMPITVTNYSGSEPLTNFPLLVLFHTNLARFSYGQFQSPPWSDLRFSDADGTNELPYEVESWDTNGSSFIWVLAPVVTNGTRLLAWWGKAGETAPSYSTNGQAWPSAFRAVWHLGHGSGTNVLDSTTNRRHGVTFNMPAQPWTNAVMGNGLAFDGVNDYVFGMGAGVVPTGTVPYTVSVWFKRSVFSGAREMLSQWTTGGNSFFLGFSDNNARFSDSWPTVGIGLLPDSDWHQLVAVSTTNNAFIFLDGELRAAKGSPLTYTAAADLYFGRQGTYLGGAEWFGGVLDEIRVEGTSRSAAWIRAAYENQRAPRDFLAYGEAADLTVPLAQPLPPSPLSPTNAFLRGEVLSEGQAEPPSVWFCWGPEDAGTGSTSSWPNVVAAGTHGLGSIFSTSIEGLTSEGVYVYRCYATNSAGEGWSQTAVRFQTPPDLARWPYRMKMSLPVSVGETLTNFPLLVRFENNINGSGFYYAQCAQTNGGDLRFADPTETVIFPHEIERWNTNGISTVWVKIPALVGTNDYFYAYWGKTNAAAPASLTNGMVWSPEFRAVWHLGHTGGTNVLDSTTNRRHGVTYNMPANPWTNAAVGNGLTFDGVNDYVFGMGNGIVPKGGWPYTVSVWFQRSAFSGNREMLSQWAVSGQSFFLGFENNNVRFSDSWPSVAVGLAADTNWHHLVAISTLSNAFLFLDGDLKATKGSPLSYTDASALYFGRQGVFSGGAEWYAGVLDEVRVESLVRSTNWIRACWLNQKPDSTFLTYHNAELRSDWGWVDNTAPEEVTLTSATLKGMITNLTESAHTLVFWGPSPGGTDPDAWANSADLGVSSNGPVQYTVTTLSPATTYYYRYALLHNDTLFWSFSTVPFITGELSISAPVASTAEHFSEPGQFQITRPASCATEPLTVNVAIGGTASNGVDYSLWPTQIVLSAGSTSLTLAVRGLEDTLWDEETETVTLTILPGAYALGSSTAATVSIFNEPHPTRLTYKADFRFEGYDRPEPLTNFPALIIFGNHIPNFSYSSLNLSTPNSLRFVAQDRQTVLPFEVERWDTNGPSFVWVRMPELTASTRITAYWDGDPRVRPPLYSTNGSMWVGPYAGVWHMDGTPGTTVTVSDSSPYFRHGLAYNMPTNPWTNGKIGRGLAFDGVNDYVHGMGYTIVPLGGQPYTISVWFQRSLFTGNRELLSQWTAIYNSFYLGFTDNNVRFSDNWPSVDVGLAADTNWHHLVAVSTPNNAYLYLDGILKATRGSALTYTAPGDLYFGRQGLFNNGAEWFGGIMDEVRIETVSRSSNWIWASYLNTASNTSFITYGPAGSNRSGTLILIK